MANEHTKWQDHVVERPRTYTEVTNSDGSKTYTPAPGEIIQQGTSMSAINFNRIEEGLSHLGAAMDWLQNFAGGGVGYTFAG